MNIFRIVCLGLVQGILLFGSGMADDDVVPDSATPVKFDFAQWCKVGSHKFILESATLADVVRALDGGHIVDTSEPSSADPLWAVYYLSGGNVVRFEADGDMGGDEHRLTGVSVGPVSEFPSAGRLPIISEKVTFTFGEIGMEFSGLERVMGPATLRKNTAWYKYEGQTKASVRKDIRGAAQIFDVRSFSI